MSTTVITEKVPFIIGPYSQAVISGNLVFAGGQIAMNPKTGDMEGTTVLQQTHRVCMNLEIVLKEAGSSLDNAVKTVCYLTNMDDYYAFNEVYEHYFKNKPARSCVAVSSLPKGALVEIDVVAELNK
ncbi:MAG: Rid family detoxifying hydrolase [Clostridia bacterium]|nr:Rid family detoxifying hydrolase [Clostridia bacterium]